MLNKVNGKKLMIVIVSVLIAISKEKKMFFTWQWYLGQTTDSVIIMSNKKIILYPQFAWNFNYVNEVFKNWPNLTHEVGYQENDVAKIKYDWMIV